MFAKIVMRANKVLLAQIRMEHEIYCAMAKDNHNAILGCINLTLTAMDHLEEELGRMDTRINHLAKTIAAEVTTAVATDLKKLNRRMGALPRWWVIFVQGMRTCQSSSLTFNRDVTLVLPNWQPPSTQSASLTLCWTRLTT